MYSDENIKAFFNKAIIIDNKRKIKRLSPEEKRQLQQYRNEIFKVMQTVEKPLYQIILIKKYIDNVTYKEIANYTGYSIKWIKHLDSKILSEIKYNDKALTLIKEYEKIYNKTENI